MMEDTVHKKPLIVDEYSLLLKNYKLTELMLLKKNGKRKQIGNSYGVYILLQEVLEKYGIALMGMFTESNMEFRCIVITPDFPPENEILIQQLYGYHNLNVEINMEGFEECSYSFRYNTSDGSCLLKKNVYWSVVKDKKFNNLKEMLNTIREKGYENSF